MTNHVTPKRMKGNRVYLPTLGTITIPCGIAFHTRRNGASPMISVKDMSGKVVTCITVCNPTPESWMRNIKLAVKELAKVRPTLLCRRALKVKVANGPIPGCGQPGVYSGDMYPTPRAADPLEKVIHYTSSLRHAVSLRVAAEERYNEHWAFEESLLIPTPI